jgi:16S rRNA (cytosine1402-N4)-methyltransferase
VKKSFHKPVLLKEVIEYLNIKAGEKYLDATLGGGGHAQEILKRGGKLLGIDCDPWAIEAARGCLSSACPDASWQLARGNFAHLKEIALEHGFAQVAGVLFDLGVSTYQLETAERGFSFNLECPLDMRMDPDLQVTAADLVNGLSENELKEIFTRFGEERYARRLAGAIGRARQIKPIKTANQLAAIILKAWPRRGRFERIHPATRCFQALRIAVNDELGNLRKALPQAGELLKPKGRLVVISFHSLEDRIVKRFFKEEEKEEKLRIITKKPIRPTEAEINSNPRSHSAKLRVAEKI